MAGIKTPLQLCQVTEITCKAAIACSKVCAATGPEKTLGTNENGLLLRFK